MKKDKKYWLADALRISMHVKDSTADLFIDDLNKALGWNSTTVELEKRFIVKSALDIDYEDSELLLNSIDFSKKDFVFVSHDDNHYIIYMGKLGRNLKSFTSDTLYDLAKLILSASGVPVSYREFFEENEEKLKNL